LAHPDLIEAPFVLVGPSALDPSVLDPSVLEDLPFVLPFVQGDLPFVQGDLPFVQGDLPFVPVGPFAQAALVPAHLGLELPFREAYSMDQRQSGKYTSVACISKEKGVQGMRTWRDT